MWQKECKIVILILETFLPTKLRKSTWQQRGPLAARNLKHFHGEKSATFLKLVTCSINSSQICKLRHYSSSDVRVSGLFCEKRTGIGGRIGRRGARNRKWPGQARHWVG